MQFICIARCNNSVSGESSGGRPGVPVGRSQGGSASPAWALSWIFGGRLSNQQFLSSPGAVRLREWDPRYWRHAIPNNPRFDRLVRARDNLVLMQQRSSHIEHFNEKRGFNWLVKDWEAWLRGCGQVPWEPASGDAREREEAFTAWSQWTSWCRPAGTQSGAAGMCGLRLYSRVKFGKVNI